MKPRLEFISDLANKSFNAKYINRENRTSLVDAWHFHPEIEICYTEQSRGKRFVGNHIADYLEQDLVMFGSNLPHGFTTDMSTSQVVIQMKPDFLGRDFKENPELRKLNKLIALSKNGLEFGKATKKKVVSTIKKLPEKEGMPQLIVLLQLLHILSEAKDIIEISQAGKRLDNEYMQLGRINIVYDYIKEHFKEEVDVKKAADFINLSEAAFYKLVKRRTKRTYTEIVNEFRVNYACTILIRSNKSIAQIGFDSGYNNPSYFIRKFKEVMGVTPLSFRKNYLK